MGKVHNSHIGETEQHANSNQNLKPRATIK